LVLKVKSSFRIKKDSRRLHFLDKRRTVDLGHPAKGILPLI
jgi:hypothetical protein